MLNRSVQVPHRGDSDSIGIALCLYDDLSTPKRVGIENNGIDATVSAGTGDLYFTPTPDKLFLENLTYQVLEILLVHSR